MPQLLPWWMMSGGGGRGAPLIGGGSRFSRGGGGAPAPVSGSVPQDNPYFDYTHPYSAQAGAGTGNQGINPGEFEVEPNPLVSPPTSTPTPTPPFINSVNPGPGLSFIPGSPLGYGPDIEPPLPTSGGPSYGPVTAGDLSNPPVFPDFPVGGPNASSPLPDAPLVRGGGFEPMPDAPGPRYGGFEPMPDHPGGFLGDLSRALGNLGRGFRDAFPADWGGLGGPPGTFPAGTSGPGPLSNLNPGGITYNDILNSGVNPVRYDAAGNRINSGSVQAPGAFGGTLGQGSAGPLGTLGGYLATHYLEQLMKGLYTSPYIYGEQKGLAGIRPWPGSTPLSYNDYHANEVAMGNLFRSRGGVFAPGQVASALQFSDIGAPGQAGSRGFPGRIPGVSQ